MVATTPGCGDADDGTSPVSTKGMEMTANLESSGRGRRLARIGVSLAVLGLLASSLGVASVSAAGGPGQHATFTKWITSWPSMAGNVGGTVGDGAFSGTVIDYAPGPTTLITAIYHFGGSRHEFTARMHVEQTGLQAVIVGVVTDGWGKGKLVTGEYTQITCQHGGLTTDCFRGSVDVGGG
jgi:hypothetical protein